MLVLPTHYTFTTGNIRNRILLKYTGTVEDFRQRGPKYAPGTEISVLAPGESVQVASATR